MEQPDDSKLLDGVALGIGAIAIFPFSAWVAGAVAVLSWWEMANFIYRHVDIGGPDLLYIARRVSVVALMLGIHIVLFFPDLGTKNGGWAIALGGVMIWIIANIPEMQTRWMDLRRMERPELEQHAVD